jgi:hypothetical protein
VFLRHFPNCLEQYMPISKPGPPDWGIVHKANNPTLEKMVIWRSPKKDAAIITRKYIASIIVDNKVTMHQTIC